MWLWGDDEAFWNTSVFPVLAIRFPQFVHKPGDTDTSLATDVRQAAGTCSARGFSRADCSLSQKRDCRVVCSLLVIVICFGGKLFFAIKKIVRSGLTLISDPIGFLGVCSSLVLGANNYWEWR